MNNKKTHRNFLRVIDAEVAAKQWRATLNLQQQACEEIPIERALGRILARDFDAPLDVPGFDRSNVDGYAVRAADTFGADENTPTQLRLSPESIHPGVQPRQEVVSGQASYIATGGMLPRGADAVVMIEYCEIDGSTLTIRRAAQPGSLLSFAGSDIALGERVLHAGTRLGARETGTLAALGVSKVLVHRQPRIGVLSSGDELVELGEARPPGFVHDCNRRIISDSLREIGCEAVDLGIAPDDLTILRTKIKEGLALDGLLLSGGTSKGEGDYCALAISELADIVAHGIAVKPGKPLCLATYQSKPVVVLPGFPTSAVFTFHEFVAPILRELCGLRGEENLNKIQATVPHRIESDGNRKEFILVNLLQGQDHWLSYPLGKGSGSITSFCKADGFITIDRDTQYIEKGSRQSVQLLGKELEPADLVIIGSHCLGLDLLLSELRKQGFHAKTLAVGSSAGFHAANNGECDLAGVHLRDAKGIYNKSFAGDKVHLIKGYRRKQGILSREAKPDLAGGRMVNRNIGSGTQILIDELIAEQKKPTQKKHPSPTPAGYAYRVHSHNAVAAAIAQGRADWGVAIESVAQAYQLEFQELCDEEFDFVVPHSRISRPAVQAFIALLSCIHVRSALAKAGFTLHCNSKSNCEDSELEA